MSSQSPGAEIRRHRRAARLTQADLAERAGVSVRMVCSLEAEGKVSGAHAAKVITAIVPPDDRQAVALPLLARCEPELYALAGAPLS